MWIRRGAGMGGTLLIGLVLGCSASDPPTLALNVDQGMLSISIVRSPGHSFTQPLTASANGIDCGTASTSAGTHGKLFDQAASGASATFQVPRAKLGESLHVEVTEGDEHFVLDAPTFGSARSVHVLTPLDQPLHAGDWVEVTSGVSTDKVIGGMSASLPVADPAASAPSYCFVQWGTDVRPTSVRYQIPPKLSEFWWCGRPPASGIIVAATLSIDLDPQVQATTCSGPSLTCAPIRIGPLHGKLPFTVQM